MNPGAIPEAGGPPVVVPGLRKRMCFLMPAFALLLMDFFSDECSAGTEKVIQRKLSGAYSIIINNYRFLEKIIKTFNQIAPNMKKKETFVEIITFLFILLFVYAAVSKLLDVEKFKVQVGQSPLLTNMAGFIVWFIPGIEILISLMLVFPRTRLIALYASFSLMVMFTAYIIAILNFSETIPCSCGGVLSSLGWKEHLIFNFGFVLLGLVGVVLQTRQRNDVVNVNPSGKSVTAV